MVDSIFNLFEYFGYAYEIEGDRVKTCAGDDKFNLDKEKLMYLLEHGNPTKPIELVTLLALTELWERGEVDVKLSENSEIEVMVVKPKRKGLFSKGLFRKR